MNFSFFIVFLKNRNVSSKIKRSKSTDYAALNHVRCHILLYIDIKFPAEKRLTSWHLFVMSYCEFVTFTLVSWVRCGA